MNNVVLITIDCFGGRFLRPGNEISSLLPFINKLAKKGIYFTECISSGPVTPFAFPGLFTGISPLFKWQKGKLSPEKSTIAEIFKSEGYHTIGIHDNPYLNHQFGYDRGFDIFIDDAADYDHMTSPNILKKVKGSIPGKSPFFLWVHFMDLHCPYMFPDEYYEVSNLSKLYGWWIRKLVKKDFRDVIDKPRRKKAVVKLYQSALKWVDHNIKQLIGYLEKNNLFQDSLITLTADHGEGLGKHGYIGHFSYLYDDVLKIPLVMKLPENSNYYCQKRIFDQQISQLDILPTLLNLLNIEYSEENMQGKDLTPLIENSSQNVSAEYSISECLHEGYRCTPSQGVFYDFSPHRYKLAVRSKLFKYIFDGETTEEKFYSLTEDPNEQNNIIDNPPQEISEMRDYLRHHLSELEKSNNKSTTSDRDEENISSRVKERLQYLGYLE